VNEGHRIKVVSMKQASDQGEGESLVSRSEVVCSYGFSLSLADTIKLCSVKGSRAVMCLTGGACGEVRSSKGLYRSFCTVTTVLPTSGFLGAMGQHFGVRGTIPQPGAGPNTPAMESPVHNSVLIPALFGRCMGVPQ
jgi:hypothetical protein